MPETAEQRKERHRREKERIAADPEYARLFKEKQRAATRKYKNKHKDKNNNKLPGRLVASFGWLGWS